MGGRILILNAQRRVKNSSHVRPHLLTCGYLSRPAASNRGKFFQSILRGRRSRSGVFDWRKATILMERIAEGS